MFRLARVPKFLLTGCMLAAAGELAYPPDEALQLVAITLKQNPALASARLSANVAHSQSEQNRAWEAPEVRIEAYQTPVASFPNPVKNGMEYDYSISQVIPFPGKLDAMAKPHHLHGNAEQKRADAFAIELRREVLSAYAELYSADWQVKLIREDRVEVDRLLAITRRIYEAGTGTQADLLRIESERVRLDIDALEAAQKEAEARASIVSLLGDNRAGINMPDSIAPGQLNIGVDSLGSLALERRPDLDAMRQEVFMAKAEITSKGQEAYPDFSLQGVYKDMRTDVGARGFWSLGVGMKVPFAPWSWKGVKAGTEQARILLRKSEKDYTSAKLMVRADVERAFAELSFASGRLDLATNRRIPLANQTLQSSLSAYRGGKGDFNSVIMAFRELREARQKYHTAVADHLKAWASLEWATGGTLNVSVSKG